MDRRSPLRAGSQGLVPGPVFLFSSVHHRKERSLPLAQTFLRFATDFLLSRLAEDEARPPGLTEETDSIFIFLLEGFASVGFSTDGASGASPTDDIWEGLEYAFQGILSSASDLLTPTEKTERPL